MVLVVIVMIILAFWTAMLAQAIHALHRHDVVADVLVREFSARLEQMMDAQLRRFDVRSDVQRRISIL